MKDVTQRRLGELSHKLFDILAAEPAGLPRQEALARLAAAVTLTPHEAGVYPSTGRRRFEHLICYVTSSFVRAGWMQKSNGMWWTTEAGRTAAREVRDPAGFVARATRLRNAQLATTRTEAALAGRAPITSRPGPAGVSTPLPPAGGLDLAAVRAQAWQDIARHVLALDPHSLERIVAALLRAMGWRVTFVATPGRDGGIDVVGLRDALGIATPRLKVQVKHGETRIGPPVLRAFMALLRESDAGVVISTGGFTREAEELERLHADRLTLVDLPRFIELWAEHEAQVDARARACLPLTRVLFVEAVEEPDRAMPAGVGECAAGRAVVGDPTSP